MKLLRSLSPNTRNVPGGVAVILICLITFRPGVAQPSQDTLYSVDVGETLFSISQKFEVSVKQLKKWNDLESNEINAGQKLAIHLGETETSTPKPAQPGTVRITVQPKQTLYSLARKYDVSMAQIKKWNRLESNQLNVGQQLVIKKDAAQKAVASEKSAPSSPTPAQSNKKAVDNKTQANDSNASSQPVAQAEEEPQAEKQQPDEANSQSSQQPAPAPQARQDQAADTSGPNKYYVVKKGDTLYDIARKFGLSVAQLKSLNQLGGNTINVGQRLIVGTNPDAPSIAEKSEDSAPQGQFVQYRLKSNESLTDILDKFKMDSLEFAALNPELENKQLVAGRNVTVLSPPTSSYRNPYRTQATMERVAEANAKQYKSSARGKPTTSGELYNPYQLTAAHPTLALGSIVYIENPSNGHGIYVKINDRMTEEGIRLSEAAFETLHFNTGEPNRVVIYRPPQQ